MGRTDLICENAKLNEQVSGSIVHSLTIHGTSVTEVNADTETEKRFGIVKGKYITVYTDKGDVLRCLSELLSELIPPGPALVAGLGNEDICSDSLGAKTLRYIPATAHLSGHPDFTELGMRKVFVLGTGVTGKTGIESSEQISMTARNLCVSSVIAVDSLACSDPERLCTTIQLTDTGIAPGSGVGNDRMAINLLTVGVPVIAVGVPTVIDLDSLTGREDNKGLMVTPRSIDVTVDRLSETIGRAVSRALNPTLTGDEIDSLIL